MSCACKLCQRNAEVEQRLAKLPASERDYWEGIYELLLHVEMDLNHHQALVDGSWPDADLVIQGIRERCEQRQEAIALGQKPE